MNRVVVTGMGALTPIGNSVKEYWTNAVKGVNGIDVITKFDAADSKYKFAGEVKNVDLASAIEKSQLRKMDLFSQYAVYAAKEAVEDSGILGNVDPFRFGVYFGSGVGGFDTFTTEHTTFLEKGPRRVSPLFIPKMIYNIAAGNIAITFKAKGANMAVSTACATGSTAIGEAYRAVKTVMPTLLSAVAARLPLMLSRLPVSVSARLCRLPKLKIRRLCLLTKDVRALLSARAPGRLL